MAESSQLRVATAGCSNRAFDDGLALNLLATKQARWVAILYNNSPLGVAGAWPVVCGLLAADLLG